MTSICLFNFTFLNFWNQRTIMHMKYSTKFEVEAFFSLRIDLKFCFCLFAKKICRKSFLLFLARILKSSLTSVQIYPNITLSFPWVVWNLLTFTTPGSIIFTRWQTRMLTCVLKPRYTFKVAVVVGHKGRVK